MRSVERGKAAGGYAPALECGSPARCAGFPALLDLMARRNAELESGLASAVRLLKDRVALLVRLVEQSKGNAATHRYLSTELTSLRGELRSAEKLLSGS